MLGWTTIVAGALRKPGALHATAATLSILLWHCSVRTERVLEAKSHQAYSKASLDYLPRVRLDAISSWGHRYHAGPVPPLPLSPALPPAWWSPRLAAHAARKTRIWPYRAGGAPRAPRELRRQVGHIRRTRVWSSRSWRREIRGNKFPFTRTLLFVRTPSDVAHGEATGR